MYPLGPGFTALHFDWLCNFLRQLFFPCVFLASLFESHLTEWVGFFLESPLNFVVFVPMRCCFEWCGFMIYLKSVDMMLFKFFFIPSLPCFEIHRLLCMHRYFGILFVSIRNVTQVLIVMTIRLQVNWAVWTFLQCWFFWPARMIYVPIWLLLFHFFPQTSGVIFSATFHLCG